MFELRLLLIIFFGITAHPAGAALPSCARNWSPLIQKNLHQYNRERDGSYQAYSQRLNRFECEKEWTVLIFMAADNDLSPYASQDILEMEKPFASTPVGAASSLRMDVVVQLEQRESNSIQRLHVFQALVTSHQIQSPSVQRFPKNTRLTQAAKLRAFLEWAIENYPSRQLMLIVWGHGQGWDGIAPSESNKNLIRIPELRAVMKSMSEWRGRAFDLYVSDACQMQRLEVLTEIAPFARYILGSTTVQSFYGLPYRRLFYEMNHRMGTAGDQAYWVAKSIPLWMKSAVSRRGSIGKTDPQAYQSLAWSAISSDEFRRTLQLSLIRLSQVVQAYLRESPQRVDDLQFLMSEAGGFYLDTQDVAIFLEMLSYQLSEERRNGALSPQAQNLSLAIGQVRSDLNRSVLSYVFSSTYPLDPLTKRVGQIPRVLTFWLPQFSSDYVTDQPKYQRSSFFKGVYGSWEKMMNMLFQERK